MRKEPQVEHIFISKAVMAHSKLVYESMVLVWYGDTKDSNYSPHNQISFRPYIYTSFRSLD